MDFKERFNKVLKSRGASKHGISDLMGMPYSTFLYKSRKLESWNMAEFKKLITVLRLTPEEFDFLCGKGE